MATAVVSTASKKPAKCLEECIVGPSESERASGAPSWGSSADADADDDRGKKRQRTENGSNLKDDDNDDTSSTFQHALDTFHSSGCCVIPNVLPPAFVRDCRTKATADLELLEQELNARRQELQHVDTDTTNNSHAIAAAYRVDYREMVDRDGHRRDVRYELDRYPYIAPGLIYNSIVFPLIQALLHGTASTTSSSSSSKAINLLYAGVMWARKPPPQTSTNNDNDNHHQPQKWHSDGGHLYEHIHLPPHCINVFFPLIHVKSDQDGPTQVQPGSHVLGGNFENSNPLSIFGLHAHAGDAILFDYRLQHRGALALTQHRPILYLAYAKPWFVDAGNTRSGSSIFRCKQQQRQGKPWVSRLLTGIAMPMGVGFENYGNSNIADNNDNNTESNDTTEAHTAGSGERWVLFKMNVQLDDNDAEEPTIVFYAGDVPLEVATQFCLKHQLAHDFILILTDTIQQQMVQAQKALAEATTGNNNPPS
ncbi:expressed unknown protein [Seminavis robusta]|uniref:Uncharacterized protein n=1 Tax=Seminavis robusta TaxID=568900 RepID=A0A9N8H979_9STRA|nr:expressed unknown protein [Seminavis robusta]|eukprot:Sro266_g103170.1 n/a (480) ;mRNA; r:43148-44587